MISQVKLNLDGFKSNMIICRNIVRNAAYMDIIRTYVGMFSLNYCMRRMKRKKIKGKEEPSARRKQRKERRSKEKQSKERKE